MAHKSIATIDIQGGSGGNLGNAGTGSSNASKSASHNARHHHNHNHNHNHNHHAQVAHGANAARAPKQAHRPHRKPEQNLNHLLNFTYARRTDNNALPPVRKAKRTNPSYGLGSGYHPLDKAHFVNANYRFVVHPSSGDGYRSNLLQADLPVPWENVLQVIASAQTQRDNCPICLDSVPVAPRMAKCGHVFCYPCVLRYLASEDIETGRTNGKWRKCPICHDGIYPADLRPVKWFEAQEIIPQQGHDVLLRLISRQTGSMHALPRDAPEVDADTVPWHNQAEVLEYARIVRGDAKYMRQSRDNEITDLLTSREADAKQYGQEDPWMTIAMDKISETAELYDSMSIAPKPTSDTALRRQQRAPVQYEQHDTSAPDAFLADSSTLHPSTNPAVVDDRYYFYQPRTGCHFYLSPFDIRILKKAFEHFSAFPDHIIARVEAAQTQSLTEDLRRRTKYLSHLPLGCEVTFLECDWSGVVEEEVLKGYQQEIDRRRRKRKDKAATEDAARRRAQQAQERRDRHGGRDLQFDFDEDAATVFTPDDESAHQIDPSLHDFADSSYFGSRRSQDDRNAFDPLTQGTSFEHGRTVWGTAAIPSSVSPSGRETYLRGSENDGTPSWSEQIEQWSVQNAITASTLPDPQETPSKSGNDLFPKKQTKQQQKKKKLILLSTGFTPR
ncbi:hypothetical protein PYCC9005_002657 [Savitreella phatthalungensis]